MSRVLAVAVVVGSLAVAGCANTDTVQCGALTCPAATACDDAHKLCVDPSQLETCAGKEDATECTAVGVDAGHCLDQVCLASICGDSLQEFGEMCDDGNTVDDVDCSADCASDMTCGNGHTDVFMNEQCDDGSWLDHDGCSSQCKVERARWIEHTIAPGKRHGSAYAYDSGRGRLVVFGGYQWDSAPFERNDTIEWDGINWSKMPTDGAPSSRVQAAMAYDAARAVSVLFGGNDGQRASDDTWVWNGVEWRLLNVAGPKRRLGHVMAFDPVRKVVVLFGGFYSGTSAADPDAYLNDTWEWDGTAWTQKSSTPANTPPGRVGAAAMFDPKLGKILLIGGSINDVSANPVDFDDMWTYDGEGVWTKVNVVGSRPIVAYAGLTYDVKNQRVVLHGGYATGTGAELGAMWAWSGTTWTNLGSQTPLARGEHVFVNVGDSIVMHGGRQGSQVTDALADTWVYNGTSWSQPGDISARYYAAATNDFVHARVVAFGGLNASGTPLNTAFAISRTGVKPLATGPSARAGMAFAWNPAQDELLLMGGKSPSPVGETWEGRDDFTWNQRTAGTQPPARADAGMAYDGQNMIMFGGFMGAANTAETWKYDGSLWTNLGSSGPSARSEPAVAYDPVHERIVLFGGKSADFLADTWLWDRTSWMQVAQNQFAPPPRLGGTLTWNPARKRLTLLGSEVTGGFDAFEWDGDAMQWVDVPAANEPTNRFAQMTFTSLDGSGIQMWSGYTYNGFTTVNDHWELRWDGTDPNERCGPVDTDGDKLVGCADPDCWPICTPLCMPGMTGCATLGTRCGDGMCDLDRESCSTCPDDCKGTTCTALCGNYICETGETGCPGDCPVM